MIFHSLLEADLELSLFSLDWVCYTHSAQILPLIGIENLETKFQERNPHKIESSYPQPPGCGLKPTNEHYKEMFILTPTLPPKSLAQHFALIETSREMFVTAILAQGFFWLL